MDKIAMYKEEIEKIAVFGIGVKVADLGEEGRWVLSVGFPYIVGISRTFGTGSIRPSIGLGLAGPMLGLSFGNIDEGKIRIGVDNLLKEHDVSYEKRTKLINDLFKKSKREAAAQEIKAILEKSEEDNEDEDEHTANIYKKQIEKIAEEKKRSDVTKGAVNGAKIGALAGAGTLAGIHTVHNLNQTKKVSRITGIPMKEIIRNSKGLLGKAALKDTLIGAGIGAAGGVGIGALVNKIRANKHDKEQK